MALTARQIAALIQGPQDMMPLLRIVDTSGQYTRFDSPHPEQVEIFDALATYSEVYIIKPRQIGCSTACRAWDFIYGYTCPDPANCLIVSHEGDSTTKMHRMNADFLDGMAMLDRRLGRNLKASNRKEIILADTGFTWRCVTAGGQGAGKSFSFQRGHFTEVGSWDKNCDAQATWASLRATMHRGPHYQLIAESTGHGPKTLWEDLIYQARRSQEAHVVFSRWADHPTYRADAPVGFEDKLTTEEDRLMKVHGLDLGQIYWRRLKIDETGDETQFRHNYPLTIADAFMASSGYYFDADALNDMSAESKTTKPLADKRGLKVWKKPVKGLKYVVCVDASSGVGQDYTAIQVLSSEHEQVAVYHDNRTTPDAAAEIACELAHAYNTAMLMVEYRGVQGAIVLRRIQELGYPDRQIWTDERGRYFETNHVNKANAYNYARRLVNGGGLRLVDPLTIDELISIQQKDNGAIEAPPGKNDDLADALVLGVWALKDLEHDGYWTPTRRILLKHRLKRIGAGV